MVIADLLGVPEEDRDSFAERFGVGSGTNLPSVETGHNSDHNPLLFLHGTFSEYLSERRQAPRSDIMSELANGKFPDDSTPDLTEVVNVATFMFGAGQDTSARLVAFSFLLDYVPNWRKAYLPGGFIQYQSFVPKETAEALRDGYMHTGDLATIDEENFIFIVDRAKDMIVSGGENVYCAEVENALYDHPDVLEAAVIGIPDERWGEAVLAIVVPKEGKSPSEGELIEHCRGLIAGYKCPKKVVFQEQPLPKSGPGKILKTELRKPYWEGKARNVN